MIKFFYQGIYLNISERKRLKNFINDLFLEEGINLSSLNYIFCPDKYLLSINKEFLNHDEYTDIITFTLSEPSQPILGEIYISIDRVKYNANNYGITMKRELHRIIFHGALHLCGYNDKKPSDKTKMTLAEDKYLNLYFI